MKLFAPLLFALVALTQSPAIAQTPVKAAPHRAAHPAASRSVTTHRCSKEPELSPKIPALPSGASCPRPLYTLTTVPDIKFDYTSPLEGSDLRETLGIESSSFSLNYIDTKIGTGALAAPHKWYTIQYTGYLVDGTKFDSSYDRHQPFTFPVGQHQVIAGWDTGFAGMRVGGKRRLFIPFQLAYGPAGHGAIPSKAELIFDLEFVGQSDTPPTPPTPPTSPARPAPTSPKPAAPTAAAPAAGPSAAAPKPQ